MHSSSPICKRLVAPEGLIFTESVFSFRLREPLLTEQTSDGLEYPMLL
jgi:hypothetical protein